MKKILLPNKKKNIKKNNSQCKSEHLVNTSGIINIRLSVLLSPHRYNRTSSAVVAV